VGLRKSVYVAAPSDDVSRLGFRASYRMEGHNSVCRYRGKWGDGLEWADSLFMACCWSCSPRRCCHLWFAEGERMIYQGRLSDDIPASLQRSSHISPDICSGLIAFVRPRPTKLLNSECYKRVFISCSSWLSQLFFACGKTCERPEPSLD
jgi:hypothetical protein